MTSVLEKLMQMQSLDFETSQNLAERFISGDLAPEMVAGLLVALQIKGVTAEELSGFATTFRQLCTPLEIDHPDAIDCCGTGGDGLNTFNISSAVSFVLAGGGLKVCKHGNRSVSSQCGSADVLEELGIKLDLSPKQAEEQIIQNGFAFLFAPTYHPAFKNIVPIRKALKVRTLFNILGPLLNPAKVKKQVIGVYDANLMLVMVNALKRLGSERVLLVSAQDGLDEISLFAPSKIVELNRGKVMEYIIDPMDLGFNYRDTSLIAGGGKNINAKIITSVLKGEPGAPRDIVTLNAAAGFYVAEKVNSIKDGINLAYQIIDSGRAFAVLKELSHA